METKEVLVKARAVIDTPEKWTKNTLAKTEDGRRVLPNHPSATCFCIQGALGRVAGGDDPDISNANMRAQKALMQAASYTPQHQLWVTDSIPAFNDHPTTTHTDVMSLFDRAIEAAS